MKSLIGRRVLVTGASGFVGSHLVQRLRALGACVGAVSRDAGKIKGVEECELLVFDLREEEETKRAITDFAPEIVFHLAAHPEDCPRCAGRAEYSLWVAQGNGAPKPRRLRHASLT